MKVVEVRSQNICKYGPLLQQISRLELADIPINKEEEDNAELVTLEPDELKELDPKQLEYQVTVLREKLQESKPNLAVIQEYRKKVSCAFVCNVGKIVCYVMWPKLSVLCCAS